ncbi:MAG: PIN domain-containing protein [Desulfobacteraceae bacterium]|nr:PIN domain-containing protein [Desulfobacteraceae bacterium]MBC2757899.1 PIN domain-containing protein [Desulfobacteraceae bacterium]
MNILFDTNVILDVLLDRKPFSEPASQLLTLVERGEISGIICATTVTTIHYLSTKVLGENKSQSQIKDLLTLFEIASVNRTVIEEALKSKFSDFEDSVIFQAAHHAGAEAIVTRDPKGFKKSKLPVFNPIELLKILQAIE